MRTHGHTVGQRLTREYNAWRAIKNRCYRPSCERYKWYGARGIKMADCWLRSFEQFLKDVGPAPSAKHSIDRIDNAKDYEPGNCRWMTQREQCNNKRNNVPVVFNGEAFPTVRAASERLGIPEYTIRRRMKAGLPIDLPGKGGVPLSAHDRRPSCM